MKVRKVPMRTCVVTKESKPKQELVRIVRNKEMEVSIDLTGKAPGRGAYLSLDAEVIKKAQKSNILERKLEAKIPDKIYDDLLEMIKWLEH